MKSKYIIISILILSIFLSGCVDNKTIVQKQESGIVGDWKGDSGYTYIRFNSDGSGEFSSVLGKSLFQYTNDNNILKVHDVLGSGIDQPLWFDKCNIETKWNTIYRDPWTGELPSCTYKIINDNTLFIKTNSKDSGNILDRER